MEEVSHVKSFSMTFCLDCHRNPNDRLRPLDKITDLAYDRSKDEKYKDYDFVTKWHIKSHDNCRLSSMKNSAPKNSKQNDGPRHWRASSTRRIRQSFVSLSKRSFRPGWI